jgi:hypothetical protein
MKAELMITMAPSSDRNEEKTSIRIKKTPLSLYFLTQLPASCFDRFYSNDPLIKAHQPQNKQSSQ